MQARTDSRKPGLASSAGAFALTALVLVVSCCAAVATAAAAPLDQRLAPNPAAPQPIATSTIGALANEDGQAAALLRERGLRFKYIVLRDSDRRYVDRLRAANPTTKILVYKNIGFIRASKRERACAFDPYQGSGVSYCDARGHENWFLHDRKSGTRIRSSSYDTLAANVGNPGYRQRWLGNVLARLRDAGGDGVRGGRWDGVFMDDVNLQPGHGMDGRIREYSDRGYGEAVQSFVAKVGPSLQREGFVAMANVALRSWDPRQVAGAKRIARSVSVLNREHFVRWRDERGRPFTGGNWANELELMEGIGSTGTPFTAMAFGGADEVALQRYARATFLLGWDGKDGSALMYRPDGIAHPYDPDWARGIGPALGERFRVGRGWRRNFVGGTVVVNPSAGGAQTFRLGLRYRHPDGSCRTSVTLPPARGLVLGRC